MKSFREFRSDERGAVVIMLGICLLPILAVAGAAIDYSFASFRRGELQRTADAAALAGAAVPGTDAAPAEAKAKSFFLGNDTLQVTPTVSANAETVTVTATYSQPTFLLHLVGTDQTTVNAHAVAVRGTVKPPCLLTLDATEKHGIMLNSDSKLETKGCGVQVNSSNSEALVTNSNSTIKADQICVKGGWQLGSSGSTAPKKCDALPDPLASLSTPTEAAGACTKTDFTINGGTSTLAPGVYCKNLTINSGAVVTLQPGIHVIREGLLKVNSSSTLKGDNVLLFFTGKDTRMEMDSTSAVMLTGRTEGPFVDLVIYQDRNWSADFFNLNADSQSKFSGVVYLPNSPLRLNSRSGFTAGSITMYSMLVARRVELNSKANLLIDNSAFKSKLGQLQNKGPALTQ